MVNGGEMAEEGNTLLVVIGYILAVLEPFPLGLIFGLILIFPHG